MLNVMVPYLRELIDCEIKIAVILNPAIFNSLIIKVIINTNK